MIERIEVNYYMELRKERNHCGHFIKPILIKIVNQINNSWIKIGANCVANAPPVGYLAKNCPLKENYIAKYERFDPCILEEINL